MSADILRRAAALIRKDCPIPERSRAFDFIDFPTGFAIQRAGVAHLDACSAAQTGGAVLCDCEAIYPAWRRWRTLLAVADWLHTAGADIWAHGPLCECGTGCDACDDNHWEPHARAALAVASAYLGEPSGGDA